MTGDIPEAAFRLACALTVRTHRQQFNEKTRGGARIMKPSKKRTTNGRGRGGNNRQAVVIGARRFDTLGAAKATLRISSRTLNAMLDDGRAKRV